MWVVLRDQMQQGSPFRDGRRPSVAPKRRSLNMHVYGNRSLAVVVLLMMGLGCSTHPKSTAKSNETDRGTEGASNTMQNESPMTETKHISRTEFGTTSTGQKVWLYTLHNDSMTAKIMTYGAIVTELHVPDRQGKDADVVLGFGTFDKYAAG